MIETAGSRHRIGYAGNHNRRMSRRLVTLAEWAAERNLSLQTVQNHWATRPDFPAAEQERARTGSGPRAREYDSAAVDAWLARWQDERRPAAYEMPIDPDEYRTLGAIARLLGVDGKTVTQYRAFLDEHASYQDSSTGKRRAYRTRDVVDVLNNRQGHGRARDRDADRRRRCGTPDQSPR
ncbi:hypothetical protein [Nocardia wallacei]|uniref:Uncharacterized protein n=1 Tax=Nocardia wallacei TaxID=480035 RepID=A0A7G1KTV6_9NOCA|nr:hypothetical protein [Nocardia wallacei]BCK57389.1 hypothetical protein NWFMUON74_51610 [Nocardia wallacei]